MPDVALGIKKSNFWKKTNRFVKKTSNDILAYVTPAPGLPLVFSKNVRQFGLANSKG